MHRTLIYCLLFFGLTACNKQLAEDVREVTYSYPLKFTNHTKKNIHLVFYKTEEDYIQSNNPVITALLDNVHPEYEISLPDSQTYYYLDLFSDDSSITNWGRTGISAPYYKVGLSTAHTSMLNIDTLGYNYGNTRRFFLDNGSQSRWKAVDITANGESLWDKLEDHKKHFVLTLNKNMKFKLEERNPDGTPTFKEEWLYTSGDREGSQVAVTMQFHDTLSYNGSVTATNHWGSGETKSDSLYLFLPAIGFYILQRQK